MREQYPKLDVSVVTDYEEYIENSGGCETCCYESIVLEIEYLTNRNKRTTFTYDGSLAEIIYQLDK